MSLPAKTSEDRPGARLKHRTGAFAAGREASPALQLRPDGAFYPHLGQKPHRSTRQYERRHADSVKALAKSRRTVVVYPKNHGARESVKHSRPAISTGRVRS